MSLANKVATWSIAFASLALLLFSIVAAVLHEREEIEFADRSVRSEMDSFFTELQRRNGDVQWINTTALRDALGSVTRQTRRCEIFGPEGSALFRTPNLAAETLARASEGVAWTMVDGVKMRVHSRRQGGLLVRIAADFDAERHDARGVLRQTAIALPIVLAVVAGLAWVVARRMMRPLREMANAASRLDSMHASARLSGAARKDEIGRLARAFNGTLERLESNLAQAMRFSADASHELKTPIAVLRAGLGELLHSPTLAEADQAAVAELMEHVGRITMITDALLMLARADAGKLTVATRPVEISSVIAEVVADFELLNEEGVVHIELAPMQPIRAITDESLLRQILVNLLDNAVKYNMPGGRVAIELRMEGGRAAIHVGNTGPGIPADQQARIFERFFRAQHTSSVRGTGLGLCLAREIARAIGAELSLAGSKDGWTEFSLAMPVIGAAAGADARE